MNRSRPSTPASEFTEDGGAVDGSESLANGEEVFMSPTDLQGDDEPEEYIPPENLAMVCKGVYRSALPKKKNFPYLRRMGLRSILTLFQVCKIYTTFSRILFTAHVRVTICVYVFSANT